MLDIHVWNYCGTRPERLVLDFLVLREPVSYEDAKNTI